MNLASIKKRGKLLILVLFLLLVLAGTILFGKTAANLLVKASVCPAQTVTANQVGANSAVISWETGDVTQGRLEYGTNPTNLTFTAPEATGGKTHNVPLTLLTPNTVYYYLITIGDVRCDSSGQKCEGSCVPWSFTTATLVPPEKVEQPLPGVSSPSATPKTTPGAKVTGGAVPTHALSTFCNQVRLNIGSSNRDATKWATVKQYDIDNNGVINGLDIIKCQKAGK